jgi:hypothetical protein
MIDNSLHHEDAGMDEYLQRAVRRGTQLRRRRYVAQATAAVVAVCAVIIPLGVLTNTTSPSQQIVDSSSFARVSWSHVAYPGLNFTDAQYPTQMGCGPGFPAIFPVQVEQVTYIHTEGTPNTLALVLVKCESATPTPSSLYAFAPGGNATKPRLVQVPLAPPSPRSDVLWYAEHFKVAGNVVSLPARAVTGTVTGCCPNYSTTLRWKIERGRFVSEHHAAPPKTNRG